MKQNYFNTGIWVDTIQW